MPKTLVRGRRTRIVNFRLTEQEFHQIFSACTIAGVTNLSEFARNAVLDVACGRNGFEAGIANSLVSLDRKLAHIDSTVGALIDSLKAPPSGH